MDVSICDGVVERETDEEESVFLERGRERVGGG
jgi:hypothetical protein